MSGPEVCAIYERIRRAGRAERNASPSKLSLRERQVLALLSYGLSCIQIGDLLCLSPKTIDRFRSLAYEKLDIANRIELTRWAIRHEIDVSTPVSLSRKDANLRQPAG